MNMNRKSNRRPENAAMEEFLAANGIEARVKFLWTGSLKGRWSLYGPGQAWTPELRNKLDALGFRDFDGRPLGLYAGNGGAFSVCVVGPAERFPVSQVVWRDRQLDVSSVVDESVIVLDHGRFVGDENRYRINLSDRRLVLIDPFK